MPISRKKKCSTLNTPDTIEGQSAPPLPDQQTFQRYLRDLARGAIRVVLEGVMREELDVLIGVGWGESSPDRKGYRNGFYSRDLVTTSGRIEDLQVPRDREGQFHTQVFERYLYWLLRISVPILGKKSLWRNVSPSIHSLARW